MRRVEPVHRYIHPDLIGFCDNKFATTRLFTPAPLPPLHSPRSRAPMYVLYPTHFRVARKVQHIFSRARATLQYSNILSSRSAWLTYVHVLLEHVEDALPPGLADPQPRVQEADARRPQHHVSGDSGDRLRSGKRVAHDAAAQKLAHRLQRRRAGVRAGRRSGGRV